jgi:hypothetical protein
LLELDFIADEDLVLLSRIYTHPYYNLLIKRFLKYGISIINGVLSGMSVIQKSAEDYLDYFYYSLSLAVDEYTFGKRPFRIFFSYVLARQVVTAIKVNVSDPISTYLSLDNVIGNADETNLCFMDSGLLVDDSQNVRKIINNRESIEGIFSTLGALNKTDFLKQIFELKSQGYTYKEISLITGRNEKTIRNTIYEVRKKLVIYE